MTQTFSFVYSDPAGASNITHVLLLINNALSGFGSCHVQVDPTQRYVWLLNDGASSWLGPIVMGSGTLQNSQCTINGASSTVVGAGNTVTMSLALTFQPSFAGVKNIYGLAYNATGLNSGWTPLVPGQCRQRPNLLKRFR